MVTRHSRLGIDFGTSTTVAIVTGPDEVPRPLLFDGSELMPSAVCLGETGTLLAGKDAEHAGQTHPANLERYPKRTIDDGTVLLGETEVPVVQLIAAVLRRVTTEADRATRGSIGAVTLTCPAKWGNVRRGILMDAAGAAHLGAPRLIAEPVSAAYYFAKAAAHQIPLGAAAVVYDLGAGTFDASVVRRSAVGVEVLAEVADHTCGGLYVDEAIESHIGATYSHRDPALWHRVLNPTSIEDHRTVQTFRSDIRNAKHMLSRATRTTVAIPFYNDEMPLGREQLEQIARPILNSTIRSTLAAIRNARLATTDIHAVFLVGGGSRLPLVTTLLHQTFGFEPTAMERPEFVVVEGSFLVPSTHADAMATETVGQLSQGSDTTRLGIRHEASGQRIVAPDHVRYRIEHSQLLRRVRYGVVVLLLLGAAALIWSGIRGFDGGPVLAGLLIAAAAFVAGSLLFEYDEPVLTLDHAGIRLTTLTKSFRYPWVEVESFFYYDGTLVVRPFKQSPLWFSSALVGQRRRRPPDGYTVCVLNQIDTSWNTLRDGIDHFAPAHVREARVKRP